jgi:hypothetical protein
MLSASSPPATYKQIHLDEPKLFTQLGNNA